MRDTIQSSSRSAKPDRRGNQRRADGRGRRLIDGKIVVKDRKVTTIDEDALRAEVADYMKGFIADHEDIVKARASAVPYMLEAHKRVWDTDVGMNRFMEQAPRK